MRIAVGGIHTECSTYSPVFAHLDDFRVLRGDELTQSEYFSFLASHDAQTLPLLHARAIPGGPVEHTTYQSLKQEFLDRLARVLPVDGVYLAMHGAIYVDGMEDAEGDWITAVRKMIGPDVPISASYDLHGNVSQRIIDQIDIFTAYRTAPHIDVRDTMETAFTLLLRSLREGVRPGVVWVKVPLLLPGERSSTEDEPAKSLYARLPASDQKPGIWRSDLMIGYVWADEPRATACAVITGTDRAIMQAEAMRIAQDFWNARNDFRFGPVTGPLDDMLDIAASTTTAPVILADSGDNPTGGGVGDRADVLAALIARNWSEAIIAGITDGPAVATCFAAGIGAEIPLKIGASLDPSGKSVSVKAKILSLHDDDRQAVVAIGGLTVVLAAKRRPYHNIADFTRLGLDPTKTRLLVVKSGYLSPELAPLANPNLMALTDGVVNQDIPRLGNARRPAGTVPFDIPAEFTPIPQISSRFTG